MGLTNESKELATKSTRYHHTSNEITFIKTLKLLPKGINGGEKYI